MKLGGRPTCPKIWEIIGHIGVLLASSKWNLIWVLTICLIFFNCLLVPSWNYWPMNFSTSFVDETWFTFSMFCKCYTALTFAGILDLSFRFTGRWLFLVKPVFDKDSVYIFVKKLNCTIVSSNAISMSITLWTLLNVALCFSSIFFLVKGLELLQAERFWILQLAWYVAFLLNRSTFFILVIS